MKKVKKIIAVFLSCLTFSMTGAVYSSATDTCYAEAIHDSYGSYNQKTTVMLTGSGRGYRVSPNSDVVQFPNFPVTYQGNNGGCWAYCVQSIYMYVYGYAPPSVDEIIRAAGLPSGATAAQMETICRVLGYYLRTNVPYSYYTIGRYCAITEEEIIDHIHRALPFMIILKDTNSNVGHSVLCVGYCRDSTGITDLFLMNPARGTIAPYSFSSPQTFSFHDGSRNYKWYNTITLSSTLPT